MATTTVRVLGPLVIEIAGVEHVPPPAQRRVLAHLVVASPRASPADELIDRLWGARPPETARTSLQVHVSSLRRRASDLIDTTSDGYRLGNVDVDVDRFEDLVGAGSECSTSGRWSDAVDAARSAIDLWRGMPFRDIDDHPDTQVVVRHLLNRRLTAVDTLATSLASLGRHDVVATLLPDHLTLHQDDERLREHLMLALHQVGRRAAALSEYEAFRRHLAARFDAEPTQRLRDLARRIRQQDPTIGPAVEPAAPTNLPPSHTPLIGRETELATIARHLGEHRLVTLAGGPGFGKTRLAIEAGERERDRRPSGVWHIDLAGVSDRVGLASTIALGSHLEGSYRSLGDMAAALASRPALLVLDGCDDALEAVRDFANAVLGRPGRCALLATARRPLAVPGERVVSIDPLTDEDDALALLVDRAQRVRPGFTPSDDERSLLPQLAADLGGIPLALELAGRWLPSIGVENTSVLLERVRRESGLESAFELGSGLVADVDRELLARMAVFEAPVTLQRADVAGGDGLLPVAGSLARLTDASLVVMERHRDAPRYRLLPPVRELARRRLDAGDWDHLRDRHAQAFVAAAMDLASDLVGPGQGRAAQVLDTELPDLRAAMRRLIERSDHEQATSLVETLSRYWYARFLGWEGLTWIESIPTDELGEHTRARLEGTAGFLAWSVHDYERADAHYRAALEIGRRSRDDRIIADALFGLGIIHQKRRFEDGSAMLREAAGLYEALPDCRIQLGECRLFLGLNEARRRDPATAARMLSGALELFEAAGYDRQSSKAHRWLAHAARRMGDETGARRHVEHAHALARASGDDVALAGALLELARIELRWGSTSAAARHIGQTLRLVPPSDEVDLSQVLFPAAELAVAEHDPPLAAAILSWIGDVYERAGWMPLDTSPDASALLDHLPAAPIPDTTDLLDRVWKLLDRAG